MLTKTKDFVSRFLNKNERQLILNHVDENGHAYRYDENGKREYFAPALASHDWSKVRKPITRQQAKEWVVKLRSGQFKQGSGWLAELATVDTEDEHSEEWCFCCLGVLVSSDLRPPVTKNYGQGYKEYKNLATELGDDILPGSLQCEYMDLNDTACWSFSEIADQIEKDFNLA